MARVSKNDPPAIQQLEQLRAKILQLAVQGKLVAQDSMDEPASVLLERVAAERDRMVEAGEIRKPKPLQSIAPAEMAYELPSGWSWARAGQFFLATDAGWSPRCLGESAAPGAWGVLKTSAVSSGRFEPTENKALPPDLEPRPEIEVAPGDFVMIRASGSKRLVGMGAVVEPSDTRLMLSDKHIRIRCLNPAMTTYWAVFNGSDAARKYYSAESSGTSTMSNVTRDELAAIPLPVPPLAEQQRIVEKVDELMAAIDELEAYLRRVEALRPQILQLAVQGKLVTQDPSDEPASALLERIAAERDRLVKTKQIKKPKPLPPIDLSEAPYGLPHGWKWARLGEVCTKITDGTHHSPPNGSAGEFLYVTAKNVRDGRVNLASATRITAEVHEEIFARCDPTLGDILFVKDGATTGLTAVNPISEPFSLLSSVALLKRTADIDSRFLMHAMRSPEFQTTIRGRMAGAAITRVTLAKLNVALVPVSPLAEQKRIVDKVDELMAAIDAVQIGALARPVTEAL